MYNIDTRSTSPPSSSDVKALIPGSLEVLFFHVQMSRGGGGSEAIWAMPVGKQHISLSVQYWHKIYLTSTTIRCFIDTDALLFAIILGEILIKIAFKDINQQQFFFFYNRLFSCFICVQNVPFERKVLKSSWEWEWSSWMWFPSNLNFHLLDHLHYGDAHIHLCITQSRKLIDKR